MLSGFQAYLFVFHSMFDVSRHGVIGRSSFPLSATSYKLNALIKIYPACPACPVAPADGTGVAPEDRIGVALADGTGVNPACPPWRV